MRHERRAENSHDWRAGVEDAVPLGRLLQLFPAESKSLELSPRSPFEQEAVHVFLLLPVELRPQLSKLPRPVLTGMQDWPNPQLPQPAKSLMTEDLTITSAVFGHHLP